MVFSMQSCCNEVIKQSIQPRTFLTISVLMNNCAFGVYNHRLFCLSLDQRFEMKYKDSKQIKRSCIDSVQEY